MFGHLVPSWWNCLGKVSKYDCVGGGMSLEGGLRFLKAMPFTVCVLFPACDLRCKLLAVLAAIPLLYNHGLQPSLSH